MVEISASHRIRIYDDFPILLELLQEKRWFRRFNSDKTIFNDCDYRKQNHFLSNDLDDKNKNHLDLEHNALDHLRRCSLPTRNSISFTRKIIDLKSDMTSVLPLCSLEHFANGKTHPTTLYQGQESNSISSGHKQFSVPKFRNQIDSNLIKKQKQCNRIENASRDSLKSVSMASIRNYLIDEEINQIPMTPMKISSVKRKSIKFLKQLDFINNDEKLNLFNELKQKSAKKRLSISAIQKYAEQKTYWRHIEDFLQSDNFEEEYRLLPNTNNSKQIKAKNNYNRVSNDDYDIDADQTSTIKKSGNFVAKQPEVRYPNRLQFLKDSYASTSTNDYLSIPDWSELQMRIYQIDPLWQNIVATAQQTLMTSMLPSSSSSIDASLINTIKQSSKTSNRFSSDGSLLNQTSSSQISSTTTTSSTVSKTISKVSTIKTSSSMGFGIVEDHHQPNNENNFDHDQKCNNHSSFHFNQFNFNNCIKEDEAIRNQNNLVFGHINHNYPSSSTTAALELMLAMENRTKIFSVENFISKQSKRIYLSRKEVIMQNIEEKDVQSKRPDAYHVIQQNVDKDQIDLTGWLRNLSLIDDNDDDEGEGENDYRNRDDQESISIIDYESYRLFLFDLLKETIIEKFVMIVEIDSLGNRSTASPPKSSKISLLLPLRMQKQSWPLDVNLFAHSMTKIITEEILLKNQTTSKVIESRENVLPLDRGDSMRTENELYIFKNGKIFNNNQQEEKDNRHRDDYDANDYNDLKNLKKNPSNDKYLKEKSKKLAFIASNQYRKMNLDQIDLTIYEEMVEDQTSWICLKPEIDEIKRMIYEVIVEDSIKMIVSPQFFLFNTKEDAN
ncbi:coiled-coil domain-containing protein 6-like [Sarcoptes scabiei]|nr:coiled-coil domain-containing protein 6-like [Sarcoptes scabiei]